MINHAIVACTNGLRKGSIKCIGESVKFVGDKSGDAEKRIGGKSVHPLSAFPPLGMLTVEIRPLFLFHPKL